MERLVESPERTMITELVNAYDYDGVGKIDGIEIQERVVNGDDKIRGAEFAFGMVLREDWAQGEDGIDKDFWVDPATHLRNQGFFKVDDDPREGDVVGYAIEDYNDRYPTSIELVHMAESRRRKPFLEHFGILQTDGRVLSKFSTGHIYLHDLDKVSTSWAHTLHYFGKRPANEYIRERDWWPGMREITYDPIRGTVITGEGEEKTLKKRPDELMEFLSSNQNRMVNDKEIMEEMDVFSKSSIYRYVSGLRKAAEDDPKKPVNIINAHEERTGGYIPRGIIVKQSL